MTYEKYINRDTISLVNNHNTISRAIESHDIEKIREVLPEFVGCKPTYNLRRGVKFTKYCKKWGEYSPEYMLYIDKMYSNSAGQKIEWCVESCIIGYNANLLDVYSTKFGKITEKTYKDCVLVSKKIRYKNSTLAEERIIRKGRDSYHLEDSMTPEQGYKALQNKVKMRKEKAAEAAKAKKAKDAYQRAESDAKIVTLESIKTDFGFCELGLRKFVDLTGLKDRSSATLGEVRQAFRKAPTGVRKYLRSNYGRELRQVGL